MCISQLPDDSETSGYSTSASSEIESLDDGFKFPATMASKSGTKQRAEEKVKNLDKILKSSLVLSPGKRLRLQSPSEGNTSSRCLSDEETVEANKRGRPPTRRSTLPFRATRAPMRLKKRHGALSGNIFDQSASIDPFEGREGPKEDDFSRGINRNIFDQSTSAVPCIRLGRTAGFQP
uniref:Shugoshin_C domain-containing protein n=1 Tax=Caenorhabditis tropicalis TaxID=1561998 RepID=A0A1I7V1E0_9PELO